MALHWKKSGLAFHVLNIALFAAVHELKDPPVLSPNTLPSRVTW